MINFLFCPICRKNLFLTDKSIKCENNHTFDISKQGYINLLNPGKKNNAKAGDSKEMIKARSGFFATGAYAKISNCLCDILSKYDNGVILDAGCGEGYYSLNIAGVFRKSTVLGFDMSKFGAEHAAKISKRESISNASFFVGNIFDLPVQDSSCDIVVNMFAPVADTEFARVLKGGGHLIIASSGKDHLMGLKEILYDSAYENEANVPSPVGFRHIKTVNLKYTAQINSAEDINNLFMMTPYYHRTSLADKQKLLSVNHLTTTVEVNFNIYEKNA